MPSRQFYIQQSCLNAAKEEVAMCMSESTPGQWLSYRIGREGEVPYSLIARILSWYKVKVREYGAPE